MEIPGATQTRPTRSYGQSQISLGTVLVVVAMDIGVILVAAADMIEGTTIAALCSGAALIALADLVSAFLGLVSAAYDQD